MWYVLYSRGWKFVYLVLKNPPFYFVLSDILVLFVRIFLSNPNPLYSLFPLILSANTE